MPGKRVVSVRPSEEQKARVRAILSELDGLRRAAISQDSYDFLRVGESMEYIFVAFELHIESSPDPATNKPIPEDISKTL